MAKRRAFFFGIASQDRDMHSSLLLDVSGVFFSSFLFLPRPRLSWVRVGVWCDYLGS